MKLPLQQLRRTLSFKACLTSAAVIFCVSACGGGSQSDAAKGGASTDQAFDPDSVASLSVLANVATPPVPLNAACPPFELIAPYDDNGGRPALVYDDGGGPLHEGLAYLYESNCGSEEFSDLWITEFQDDGQAAAFSELITPAGGTLIRFAQQLDLREASTPADPRIPVPAGTSCATTDQSTFCFLRLGRFVLNAKSGTGPAEDPRPAAELGVNYLVTLLRLAAA